VTTYYSRAHSGAWVLPPTPVTPQLQCLRPEVRGRPARAQVSAVVSQPGRLLGRGKLKAMQPTPVAALAAARGFAADRILTPEKARDVRFPSARQGRLRDQRLDLTAFMFAFDPSISEGTPLSEAQPLSEDSWPWRQAKSECLDAAIHPKDSASSRKQRTSRDPTSIPTALLHLPPPAAGRAAARASPPKAARTARAAPPRAGGLPGGAGGARAGPVRDRRVRQPAAGRIPGAAGPRHAERAPQPAAGVPRRGARAARAAGAAALLRQVAGRPLPSCPA